MNRDFDKEISVAPTLVPAVRTAAVTAATSVDLAGFKKAAFLVSVGTLTDGTWTFDPEESDDGSSWSNIAADDLSGSFAVATSAADDTTYEVGYLGSKRYVRCNVAVSGASSGGPFAVYVIRAGARTLPQ